MATTSKNGYEIRSDLLGLAKSLAEFNFQAQVKEYEYNIKKEGEHKGTVLGHISRTKPVI